MTVIAYDGKTLAADRRITVGDIRMSQVKLFVRRSYVMTYAGDLDDCRALADWYSAGAKVRSFPPTGGEGELIVYRKGQLLEYQRSAKPYVHADPIMAWGTGRDLALGAMAAGASALEAVEIAAKWSTSCGDGTDWSPLAAFS